MIDHETDLASIYSESSIYDSEIVEREVNEFERTQRLRQYGLLPNIIEEREIDLIESIRNADYQTDQERLVVEASESKSKCFNLIKVKKIKDFVIIHKKKCLAVVISMLIIVPVLSLDFFWLSKNNKKYSTTLGSTVPVTTPKATTSNPVPTTKEPSTKKPRHIINLNECIYKDDPLYSSKDCFELSLEFDGNLIITRTRDKAKIWGTNTAGNDIEKACLLENGNFALQDNRNKTYWSTNTQGKGGKYLILTDTGIIYIKKSDKTDVWHLGLPWFTFLNNFC